MAYLKSVPAVEGPGPEVRLGPAARFFMVTGRFTTTAEYIKANAPPPLQIVAAYTPEAFTEVLRNGIALGGRKLGHMREEALGRLSALTQAQIADLYSYLHDLQVPPATRRRERITRAVAIRLSGLSPRLSESTNRTVAEKSRTSCKSAPISHDNGSQE